MQLFILKTLYHRLATQQIFIDISRGRLWAGVCGISDEFNTLQQDDCAINCRQFVEKPGFKRSFTIHMSKSNDLC